MVIHEVVLRQLPPCEDGSIVPRKEYWAEVGGDALRAHEVRSGRYGTAVVIA
jgi:hypothetical protein